MLKRICDRCGRIMKSEIDDPNFNSVVSVFLDRDNKIMNVYEKYNLCNECKKDFEAFLSRNLKYSAK